MRELGELRKRRQRQRVAPCLAGSHARRVATQNARIRQRLGAEIARVADLQGMKTQGALAERARIGLRTVVAVQRGDKVSDRTLRKIENALRLRTGAIDEYLEEKIDELKPLVSVPPEPPHEGPPVDLRDDVERKLWSITDLSEEYRWIYIRLHRMQLEEQNDAARSGH